MTNCPSRAQTPLRIGCPSRTAPDLPQAVICSPTADRRRRSRSNMITSADQDALGVRPLPSSRRSRSTVAGSLSPLSP